MAVEGAHELASGQFPYLDCLIHAFTGQGLSIGADGYTPNFGRVVGEGAHELSTLNRPWLDGGILVFTLLYMAISEDGLCSCLRHFFCNNGQGSSVISC